MQGLGTLSEDQVQELVGKYVKGAIGQWDRGLENLGAEEFAPFDGPDGFRSHIDELGNIGKDLVIELNRGNYRMLESSILELLRENCQSALNIDPPSAPNLDPPQLPKRNCPSLQQS